MPLFCAPYSVFLLSWLRSRPVKRVAEKQEEPQRPSPSKALRPPPYKRQVCLGSCWSIAQAWPGAGEDPGCWSIVQAWPGAGEDPGCWSIIQAWPGTGKDPGAGPSPRPDQGQARILGLLCRGCRLQPSVMVGGVCCVHITGLCQIPPWPRGWTCGSVGGQLQGRGSLSGLGQHLQSNGCPCPSPESPCRAPCSTSAFTFLS